MTWTKSFNVGNRESLTPPTTAAFAPAGFVKRGDKDGTSQKKLPHTENSKQEQEDTDNEQPTSAENTEGDIEEIDDDTPETLWFKAILRTAAIRRARRSSSALPQGTPRPASSRETPLDRFANLFKEPIPCRTVHYRGKEEH